MKYNYIKTNRMVKSFLINTITGWKEPPRARHQLTRELAKNHTVYFIAKNITGLPRINIKEVEKNIMLIQPFFPVDHRFRYRIPLINELYQLWLFNKIKKINDIQDVINFDFTATQIFKFFPNPVYYCNDDYIGNGKYPIAVINRYHIKCENTVIKKSNLCIATSRYLTEKLGKLNPNTFEIPLGGPNIEDIKINIPQPQHKETIVVGFVGFMKNNVTSSEIINYLTEQSNIFVVMVGPPEKNFIKKVVSIKNIVFKGALTGDDLYNEISKFDVAIAPYDVENVNSGMSPNKLWQYLSIGKPVVITSLPMIKENKYPDKFVYFAHNKQEFYRCIVKANEEDTMDLSKSRIKFAGENSWSKRVEKFLKIYFEH